MDLAHARPKSVLLVALLAIARPCVGLDATIGCTEFNGDLFLTTAGSAGERTEMAGALGKLAVACHSAIDEEEDIDSEPIGLADWPDDDVSAPCHVRHPVHSIYFRFPQTMRGHFSDLRTPIISAAPFQRCLCSRYSTKRLSMCDVAASSCGAPSLRVRTWNAPLCILHYARNILPYNPSPPPPPFRLSDNLLVGPVLQALSVIVDLATAADASLDCVGASMVNASVARFARFRLPDDELISG